MSGKYDLDRDLALRGLETLRESGRPLCKHDWVGDDDCVYCRNEELESQLAEPALSEDDVRQFISSVFIGFAELIRSNPDKDIATIASKLAELIKLEVQNED